MPRPAALFATPTTVLATLLVAALAGPAAAAPTRGLTIDDMLAMQRVAEPAVAPDGDRVVFAVRDTDLTANRGRWDLYLTSVSGRRATRLTSHPDNDTSPRWSPDGRHVYFLSSRGGSSQVWRIAAAGGEAEPVTALPIDVAGFEVFPDGQRLLLAADVWPEATSLADSAARDKAYAARPSSALAYDQLLFRHWDTWEDGKYSHLLVWTPPALGGKADDARDLTPGQRTDSPTHPFGGMEEVDISPDGKTVAFLARVGGREVAWTTNTDVFLVPADGRGKPVALTAANRAYDLNPTFAPDGKSLAVLAMARPGYEADRTRVVVYDLASKKPRVVTEAWDRSPASITWSADGKTIFTSADHLGHHALFAVDVAAGKVTPLVTQGSNADPRLAGAGLVFVRDGFTLPAELFYLPAAGGKPLQLTDLNGARAKAITWGHTEQYTFKGAHGDTVYGYVAHPAGHAPASRAKVPVAVLIHGGPQGSFGDHFHYRWNPQVFAGAGFGVVIIDFHGSTGYGQAFTDAIRGDWGGAPYQDIMAGVDAALARYPWLDGTRVAALGASYGGYMINWINGQTDRFRALVCHDGNLDEELAYYQTEELWFPEWEHGGVPWDKPDGYRKHNPIDHVAKWKTPTLVIHGGLDYRVVDTGGMATFTALQRRGIPSRLLYFPDENHWVLRPNNSKRWHDEVIGWIKTWTAPGARR